MSCLLEGTRPQPAERSKAELQRNGCSESLGLANDQGRILGAKIREKGENPPEDDGKVVYLLFCDVFSLKSGGYDSHCVMFGVHIMPLDVKITVKQYALYLCSVLLAIRSHLK